MRSIWSTYNVEFSKSIRITTQVRHLTLSRCVYMAACHLESDCPPGICGSFKHSWLVSEISIKKNPYWCSGWEDTLFQCPDWDGYIRLKSSHRAHAIRSTQISNTFVCISDNFRVECKSCKSGATKLLRRLLTDTTLKKIAIILYLKQIFIKTLSGLPFFLKIKKSLRLKKLLPLKFNKISSIKPKVKTTFKSKRLSWKQRYEMLWDKKVLLGCYHT